MFSLGLLGCHRWDHAPGHAERSSYAKQRYSIIPWQMCHSGVCDLRDPEGHEVKIVLDDWKMSSPGGREQLRFQLTYRGATASCAQFAVPATGEKESPFVCNITSGEQGGLFQLTLDETCNRGTLRELAGTRTAGAAPREMSTDRVTILGHTQYAREVSLSDERGVVLFGDSGNLTVWKRPESGARLVDTVAILAMFPFLQAEGTPSVCLRPDDQGT